MDLASALTALGVKRSIWIDDYFGSENMELFDVIISDLEAARVAEFQGLRDALPDEEFDPSGDKLRGFIAELSEEKSKELEAKFLAAQVGMHGQVVRELNRASINKTSELLSIDEGDKITFEQAAEKLPALCREGDSHLGYIVDLSNRAGGPDGLDTLAILSKNKSEGTIFILTHEATMDGESDNEAKLRAKFAENNPKVPIPSICVISKERLEVSGDDAEALSEQLKVALKRAGLRRSIHGVITVAGRVLSSAMKAAEEEILEIPPEQLDKFIVERAYTEGVSELHVVERALTAKISDGLRTSFMNDPEILGHVLRIRALQPVEIRPGVTGVRHSSLERFRRMEIWEEGEVINSAYSPISCGDVFVLDAEEFTKSQYVERRFILLGQQCDIQLRSNGKRAQSYAFFVPIVEVDDPPASECSKLKSRPLPFSLSSKSWRIDYRDATQVKLSVLDLSSFRRDGKVAFDKAQVGGSVPDMIKGLQTLYPTLTGPIVKILATSPVQDTKLTDIGCQLTFTADKPYKTVQLPMHKKAVKLLLNGGHVSFEDRVTWSLRRDGRVRAPYSSSLLRDFLSISGRDAFDVDFAPVSQSKEA